MRPIATIDCETDPFEYKIRIKPFIWGVYYKGEFQHFKTFQKALAYLEAFGEKMVVYGHNAGRFDFLFPEVIRSIHDGTDLKIIHGRLAKFRIGKLEFRDSLSAVPIALGKYKKDKFKYWKLKKQHRQKYMAEIVKYLRGDCVYLHELMTAYCEKLGPSLTAAGAFLKSCANIEDFDIPKSTHAYFKELKPWYFGGRVECRGRGKVQGPIQLWDINSAYPFAMLHNHPWGCTFRLSEYRGGKIADTSLIEINAESLGAFPFGTVKFGTAFPKDKIRRDFKITGWEYNAAKDLGLLGKNPKIGNVYSFEETRNYKKYINHWYEIRKAAPSGTTDNILAKLGMNSTYGRMGLDGSQYEQYQINTPKAAKKLHAEGWQFREEAEDDRWIYFRPEPKDKWRFHDIAIAISVTGFVRAMILRTIASAEKKGATVFYIDTDGIQVKGNWTPKQGVELGQWKLEVVFSEMHYGGKKMYAGKIKGKRGKKAWKTAHKGVVMNADQIVKVAAGGEFIYRKQAPSMGILSGVKFIKRKVRATHK